MSKRRSSETTFSQRLRHYASKLLRAIPMIVAIEERKGREKEKREREARKIREKGKQER